MAYCIECVHCENKQCINKKGKLFGIELSEQLAEAEHDCKFFDEVKYKLTLKGCLYSAIDRLNLPLESDEIEELYIEFIKIATNSECIKYNEI